MTRSMAWTYGGTVAAMAAVVLASSPRPAGAQSGEAPDLVITIVVDQLRQDVLERYDEAFTGGLRRLVDGGYRFTQASHAHARTSTAPGHATISTGVLPARHAVVANAWQQRVGFRWESTYAVEDRDSPILGFEHEPALVGRSPKTMIRDALPDWIAAFDSDSRRVSISKKDRAAVPMGGQHSEHVYWILPELGRFITSTYYRDDYPGWVRDFNTEVMPGLVASPEWDTEVPEALRGLARADTASYEGDGVHTVFPHLSAQENVFPADEPVDSVGAMIQHNLWALDQPRADAAVMGLAREAIDELDLGQRGDTDYLALSLSATDRVGHPYGPFSQEVLSTLLHLDRLLGEFFDYLDEEVGSDAWVVGLTSDHGVATMPEYAQSLGVLEADRVSRGLVLTQLQEALQRAAQDGGSPDEIASRLAEEANKLPFVERAYTHHELARGGHPADSFTVLYRNSYYPGRAWDDLSRFGVDLRYGEGDYVGSPTGTNHETPYWYDRHVPIIFFGAGVQTGVSDAPVYTVDFAPTLAGLAGVPVPDDLDGRRIF
ncbi:MAG: alkaline phosphatase family protein [Gemmatimonadota bacterium]|nr:alkaline phosphatase family protein [Gemmatimonadota bacterium]